MPLYEYECDVCGRRFEVIQKFSDPPADVCKHCGKGPVHRLFSSPAIQFKGSGWYITDYAKKSKVDAGRTDGASTADAKSTDSAGKSDAATKADTTAKADTPAPATTTSSPKE